MKYFLQCSLLGAFILSTIFALFVLLAAFIKWDFGIIFSGFRLVTWGGVRVVVGVSIFTAAFCSFSRYIWEKL